MRHATDLATLPNRISAAIASENHWQRHVEPIAKWAIAEFGGRRAGHDALIGLMYDESTSDIAASLIRDAIVTLT